MKIQDTHHLSPERPVRRRLLLESCVAVFGMNTFSAASAQQNFPKGPVRIIVPFAPGGPTDTVARLIGQKLQEAWSQPVLVDYRPGAGTAIGVDFVAKSPPDGLVIGVVNSSFAVNPSLRKSLPYDTVKDLQGVTQIANLQLAVVARPDAPFNTLPEFIAYAKKNPGNLTYGTAGAGGTAHLGAELLKREANFEMLHSPFKGSAPAHTELIGGRIDLVIDPFFSVQPYVKANRMKMIATMGDKRIEGFNYPTVAETIPGFHVSALLGFIAPRATPKFIVEQIQKDIARVLQQPEMKKRIEDQGMTVVASTPAQFEAFVQSEIKRFARIVSDAGIHAE